MNIVSIHLDKKLSVFSSRSLENQEKDIKTGTPWQRILVFLVKVFLERHFSVKRYCFSDRTTYICRALHTFRERCGGRLLREIEKQINVMKKTYHLCLSAGNEIMFRDLEDYHRGFNCFAIALHKTNSTGLVEAIMSTHIHTLVQTNSPKEFMMCLRQMYTMYFNKKYGRSGKLGENLHFTMEVVGYLHQQPA